MAKLVDVKDVIDCLKTGIKAGWTLEEFAESVKNDWRDFVEIDDWKSVDEELPTEEMLNTWICFADGTVEEDTWTGKRGEEGIWASGERFTESGWYTYCDDHECRITHWKKQTTPKPPIVYRMRLEVTMATKTDYTRKCQQLDVLIDLLEKENKRRAGEIVHCEECKYSSHVCGDIYRCEWWRENGVDVYTGDFCSNGEME